MKGALTGLVLIEVPFFERKQLTTILEAKPEPWGAYAGTESAKIALDQRYHVAVLVGHGQVDRISGFQFSGWIGIRRPLHVNQLARRWLPYSFEINCLVGNFVKRWVGVILRAVLEC